MGRSDQRHAEGEPRGSRDAHFTDLEGCKVVLQT